MTREITIEHIIRDLDLREHPLWTTRVHHHRMFHPTAHHSNSRIHLFTTYEQPAPNQPFVACLWAWDLYAPLSVDPVRPLPPDDNTYPDPACADMYAQAYCHSKPIDN